MHELPTTTLLSQKIERGRLTNALRDPWRESSNKSQRGILESTGRLVGQDTGQVGGGNVLRKVKLIKKSSSNLSET